MAEQVNFPGEVSPDGGWGWMIVAGCFITTICTRAVTRCVSIFFVEFQTHFSRDYSGTAWIQALVDCTTMLCAPLGSYLGNRWSSRVAVMAGGLLSSAGLILSSFATSLEFLYLSLGILTGVGFALCYTPAIATVGVYFRQRKALAYGIAMSGSSIGTFVLAPVVQLLIELYSWRGALLILGGVSLHLCACGALMRPLVGLGRSQSHAVEGSEVDMLKTQLAEAKLHKELNLEDTKIQQYKLETAELNGIIINRDKVTTGDPGQEDRGKEQAKCLLGHGNLDETGCCHISKGVKLIDLPQRDTNLGKKKHEAESAEDPVLTDRDTTKKLKVNSKTGDAECILEKTTRFSKRNINGKFISVNLTILKTEQYASLSPIAPTNSVLVDSKLPDTNQAVSQLPDSELAGLVLANTKLPDSELAGLELANTKLPDTEPLCEMLCCTPLFINNNAKCKSREEERYFCLQVTQEYRFLLTSEFLLLAVSFLFLAFGCNVPFVHLVAYTLSIGAEPQQAALVMSIMGMMGIVGNISFGWISDRKCLRAFRVVSYLLAVGLDGLSCLCVPMLRTFPLLVPFALFYGYFDGAYVALIPVVTANIVGTTYFPTALGIVYFLHAIPYLISPPIGGWLVDQTNSYTPAFLLGGSSLICSALILATVILSRHSCRGHSHSYILNPSK